MSCPCHICLPLFDPACVLTMFINKNLHMDPYASRLVGSITEYSDTQGSSNFSDQHFSGMDTTRLLFALKQGPQSLENHIREFLAFAHYSDLPDIILIEIFCDGINQPLRSQLRREGPRSSLSCFLDFALLTVGSLFTVGVEDEDRDTASMTEMADAPERAHKMAATTTPCHVIAASHESIPFTADIKKLSKVSADLPESHHVSADLPESHHVSADLPESHHVSADLPETSPLICQSLTMSPLICQSLTMSPLICQSLTTSQRIFQSLFTSPLTIQNHVMSQLSSQSLVTFCLSHPDIQDQSFSILIWYAV